MGDDARVANLVGEPRHRSIPGKIRSVTATDLPHEPGRAGVCASTVEEGHQPVNRPQHAHDVEEGLQPDAADVDGEVPLSRGGSEPTPRMSTARFRAVREDSSRYSAAHQAASAQGLPASWNPPPRHARNVDRRGAARNVSSRGRMPTTTAPPGLVPMS